MKIYLAAPFFTPEQVSVVEGLENLVAEVSSIELYSPRKDGVLSAMTPEERRRSKGKIFELNCHHITTSQMVLAVIDHRDVGVVWELGFAYSFKRLLEEMWIVTYTDYDFGLNVMIQECVDAHVHGMTEAETVIRGVATNDLEVFSRFRKFNERVT